MASWIDYFSLTVTVIIFGGVVYGIILASRAVNEGMSSTKESLKSRGLDVSSSGVSIKTAKRFDREDYVDATQRGLVNVVNAASFRKGGAAPEPLLNRQTSNASSSSNGTGSGDEKKKRKKGGVWGSMSKK